MNINIVYASDKDLYSNNYVPHKIEVDCVSRDTFLSDMVRATLAANKADPDCLWDAVFSVNQSVSMAWPMIDECINTRIITRDENKQLCIGGCAKNLLSGGCLCPGGRIIANALQPGLYR